MKLTLLAITAILVATALSIGYKKQSIVRNVVKPEQLDQVNTWIPIVVDQRLIKGRTIVMHFASLNSDLAATIYDHGDGGTLNKACYVKALVNNTFYSLMSVGAPKEFCVNSGVTKINKEGSVLFLDADGDYFYINKEGSLSNPTQIKGEIAPVVLKGIEVGLTKSTDGLGKDYFRIFSRASDSSGNYPENFYALISNTSGNSFVESNYSSLALKKYGWQFQETSKDVSFTKIDQVNFISNYDGDWILEGQWITGYGYKGSVDINAACQYGAVNTERFAQRPGANYTMYGRKGELHFPCIVEPNRRTYQGVVAYNTTNRYFYAINRDTGRIQVCGGIPGLFENVTALSDFTRNCVSATKSGLSLGANEYFSTVGVLGAGRSNLTVVNVKNKGDDYELRQVVIDFSGASNLPTFDTQTYLYSVSYNTIYRIRKTLPRGQNIQAAFYKVTTENEEDVFILEENEKQPVSEGDKNQNAQKPKQQKVIII